MLVFVCSVYKPIVCCGISPSVYGIPCHKTCFVVVLVFEKIEHVVCLSAQPFAIFAFILTCVGTAIPTPVCSNSYAMTCLVYYCTDCLVAGIWSDMHRTSIRTIGCLGLCSVITGQGETTDTCPLVEVFDCLIDCISTTFVCLFCRSAIIPCSYTCSFGVGDDFYFFAISHCVGFVHNIRANIINRCRCKIAYVINISVL